MLSNRNKIITSILFISLLVPTSSYADIIIGYNSDGSPKYGPEPQGATAPICTPEKPCWIKNPDGSPTEAEKNYTFLPNAEERAKNKEETVSDLISPAPLGMIQIGYNTDGSPKFGPAPKGETGQISTPENPFWIKNPDGTQTAAEKGYTFLPNADERAKNASFLELNEIIEEEISTTKFKKVKKSGSYTLTSSIEMSAASSVVKVIAAKKGAKSKNITLAYNEEGQLIIKASDKLKGYQVQIISGDKVLKKITL